MAVRIGKFGMSWLQPAGQAADLLVEAGRAKGAGIAALGQGIGQGIQAFGQNRRAEKIRSEDLALREQSRQDALAERAADNARQDAEFSMRQDAWKVEVLTANRDKAMQEAQLLATAAQELGDPDIVQRAKAAESEAQRFGTALDTLLSSRMGVAKQGAAPVRGGGDVGGVQVGGKPMSQMTDAELNDLMGKSERGEVDYTYRGGATGDMGQGVGTNAPSAAPMPSASMVNDGGVMSGGAPAAPMASAPSMPQVDPRDPGFIKKQAEYAIDKIDKTFAKYAGKKTRDSQGNERDLMSPKRRNELERQRLDAVAALSYADSELQKRGIATKEAEAAAAERGRRVVAAEADAAELERVNASNRARGLPEVGSLRQIGPVETTARAEAARAFTTLRDEKKAAILSAYRDKTLGLKREAMDLVKAKFELEKAGDSNAALKADARLSKVWSDVADYADAVVSQYEFVTGSESLPEVQEARKLQAEAGREILALARKAQSAPKAAPAASVGYPSWLPPEEKAAWDAMPDSEKQRAIELGGR